MLPVPTTTTQFDPQGNITETTDGNGQVTQYTYNSQNQMTSSRVVVGQGSADLVSTTAYDENGQVSSMTDPMGFATDFAYDSIGNLASFTDPSGATTSYTYDTPAPFPDGTPRPGDIVSQVNALGQVTLTQRNALGLITHYQKGDGQEFITYDQYGDPITISAPNQPEEHFTYDANGNQTSLSYNWVNPDNPSDVRQVTVSTIYDADDRLLSTTSAAGTETYRYDGYGRTIAITTPDGTTNLTYDAAGNVIKRQLPDGRVELSLYDPDGRLIWQTDPTPDGVPAYSTFRTYDGNGNVLTEARYSNVVINLVTQGDGTLEPVFQSSDPTPLWTTQSVYGPENRLMQYTDAKGVTTTYQYDKDGNQTTTQKNVNGIIIRTQTIYNAANDPIAEIDANGNETEYIRNLVGEVVKTMYPDGSSVSFTYNARGAVTSQIDQMGRETDYTYDSSGNLLSVQDPAVFDPVTNQSVRSEWQYTYNTDGEETSVPDPYGRVQEFQYDQNGNKTGWILPSATGQGTVAEHWTYDANGALLPSRTLMAS